MNYKPRAKSEIIVEFTKHVLKATPENIIDFRQWLIGISNDVEKIDAELKTSLNMLVRKAQTSKHAREIEEHFLIKGMQSTEGGGTYPTYVFIHKLS
jgi:hypothetical protein